MAFNSLDAQREAGCDYIKSQKHQGWTLVPHHYDDGGYSGGTTDRPGLQKLLGDIQRGNVDVVVVYKVDRLSRSLADFAKLMQTFDEHHVSFVSVTQQFNTTTSMGRLTLNMLLSFAQFEREVTGERIRDKIAATKRKGVWVGGQPPLGYRLPREGDAGYAHGDRILRIVEPEAKLVRAIYDGYLELGSLVALAARLNKQGHSTKRWVSSRNNRHGGNPLTAAFLYRVLTNPIYTGHITHAPGSGMPGPGLQARSNVQVFPGQHEPIIDQATWDNVKAKMTVIERDGQQRWTHTHLLKGKLRTFEDHAMSPGATVRPGTKRTGVDVPKRRVGYYVSQKGLKHGFASCPIKRVPAAFIDDLVRGMVMDYLHAQYGIDLRGLEPELRDRKLRDVLTAVVLAPEEVSVQIDRLGLARCAEAMQALRASRASAAVEPSCPYKPRIVEVRGGVRLVLPIRIKQVNGRRRIVSPDGNDLLVFLNPGGEPIAKRHIAEAIGLAYAWRRELERPGATFESVAKAYGVADSWVHSLLALTQLSPDILGRALSGTLSTSRSLTDMIRAGACVDWHGQATQLGIFD
jgi:DNA invertase Pin-like site-specific DNA recombinase